ncbi:MAG: 16S rRNA processing protein RimM [Bacteroidales bacterium]|nr:16S rRNA processing protein RimM [Bacteroidales bacterium]
MINLDHCILLGTLTKTQGVKGKLVLRLKHLGFDTILNMESVFIMIDKLPVPFFVEEYRHLQADEIALRLKDVEDPEKAAEFVGYEVWLQSGDIRQEKESNSLQSIAPLLGYKVIDSEHGLLGILNEVIDVSQNPLLQILNESGEILIPVQQEFVIDIDDREKTIHVRTPKGLVDINKTPRTPGEII